MLNKTANDVQFCWIVCLSKNFKCTGTCSKGEQHTQCIRVGGSFTAILLYVYMYIHILERKKGKSNNNTEY